MAFGGPGATLAAGVQQPFRGHLDFGLGGLRMGLGLPEDEGDPESDSIKVLLSVDAFARVNVELNDFSLGVAGSPGRACALGAAYHRYTADLLLEAGARVDGILQRAGQESFFNGDVQLPRRPGCRRLRGMVRGEAHGIRLGASWRFTLRRRFGMDAMLSMAETMRLEGDIQTCNTTCCPPWISAGDQIMSPSKMNPTKLTLTTRNKTAIEDIRVNLPWEGAVSLHSRMGELQAEPGLFLFPAGDVAQYTMHRQRGRLRHRRQGHPSTAPTEAIP